MNPLLLFSPDSFLQPQLDLSVQAVFRCGYGILMFGTLVMALPHWRRFFMSEKWGGYAKSSAFADAVQNPAATVFIALLWFASVTCLIFGWAVVPAAFINLLLCRYYFIESRWKSVSRGCGAPGFMSHWLAAAVFVLEFATAYAPACRSLAILVFQVDFALIMLSAGLYKFTAGYPRNHGMELGMVNPEWGYWWRFYKNIPPSHIMFKTLNHLAWSTEVVAAILMLIPATRFIGAMLILLSFIYIATQIRLGLLCEMVIAGCFIFFHPGSIGAQALSLFAPEVQNSAISSTAAVPFVEPITAALLWAYLILTPLAHAGLYYNFYGKKTLPGVIQRLHEKYTNFFGLIIWRVFSVDVINFFINVYVCSPDGKRRLVSNYGWRGGLRYDHVAECIAITSVFTTLKYYSSNWDLFQERLLRYARTVKKPEQCSLEFEHVSVRKTATGFEFVPTTIFAVDSSCRTVKEVVLDESVSVRAAHAVSPVHEGVRPGSYVSLGS